MTWQDVEINVRDIASSRWNCNAKTETLAGIKCDCVLRVESDNYVIVEITKENDLSKLRTDISKLCTVRNFLISQSIYSKCFFVMKDKPTDSLRQSGEAQKVIVLSVDEFKNEYFNYKDYVYNRAQKQFGSLINIETGQPENNKYISVSYYDRKRQKEFEVTDIISALKCGKRIILEGDFGLGKSRCIKQIFDLLTADPSNNPYTIAINLREHWGAKRGIEILTRHFEELGLDAKNFIKAYDRMNTIYLLDGFDEIGTQSWSSDQSKMHHIREMSVCALKDIIAHVPGGVLIAGRDYYFNSDKEMLACLGLDEKQTIILECHREFSEAELLSFIAQNIPEDVANIKLEKMPAWFPKRPLVIQLLLKYANEIFSIDYALDDICGFWYSFLNKMCEREAKIYPALNPETIKNVLIYLANKTRLSPSNTGPITQTDLSNAFIASAGVQPNDESAIMLQRLPSLGRIDANSPNRQFLDLFILNALRSESIIQLAKNWNISLLDEEWMQPLDATGCYILSEYISKDEERWNEFLSIARQASTHKNKIFASDIVSALCLIDATSLDFQDLYISDGCFSNLIFEGKEIQRLSINESIIENMDITNAKFGPDFLISNSIIDTLLGVASKNSIPSQLVMCEVDKVERLDTTTLIKKAKMTDPQKLFVEMIRKIFFQPGAGRKEAALLRGMGASVNRSLGEKILGILLDDKIVTRHKGDEGYIYKPVRNQTRRMDKILTDLTLSKDPLWNRISTLD